MHEKSWEMYVAMIPIVNASGNSNDNTTFYPTYLLSYKPYLLLLQIDYFSELFY